jgi:hypothetical protein
MYHDLTFYVGFRYSKCLIGMAREENLGACSKEIRAGHRTIGYF